MKGSVIFCSKLVSRYPACPVCHSTLGIWIDAETVVIDLTLADQESHTRLIHLFTRRESKADIISGFEDIGLVVSILLTGCVPQVNLLVVFGKDHRTNHRRSRIGNIGNVVIIDECQCRDIVLFPKLERIA